MKNNTFCYYFIQFLFAGWLLSTGACSTPHSLTTASSVDRADSITHRLEASALAWARLLAVPEVRNFIYAEFGKKPGGHYTLLYRKVQNHKFKNGVTLGEKMQRIPYHSTTVHHAMTSMPHLYLSLPLNYQKWNPEDYVPLVAFYQGGFADLRALRAFDAKGGVYYLDAGKAPEVPVIIIMPGDEVNTLVLSQVTGNK